MDLLRRLARPMLASAFVVDGLDAMTRPARHVEKFERVSPVLEKAGLPPVLTSDATLLTRASGAVSVVAGLGLATGHAPRTCAVVLAALNLPLTVVNHPLWTARTRTERTEALSGLMRGAAVGGGLLLATVDREGEPSLAWKVAKKREVKAAIAAAEAQVRARYED